MKIGMGWLGLVFALATGAQAIDLEKFKQELTGEGAEGWVHGAVRDKDQFVFTYRNPQNFFDNAHFPLTTKVSGVLHGLGELNRHDRVLIRGKFLDNAAPIQHILVEEVRVVKKYESTVKARPYEYETKLPADLVGKSEFVGNVHAVADEGKVLVVEYRDAVIPIPVKNTDISRGLFRNDKVKIRFKLRETPPHPTHLSLDTTVAQPIQVLERIADLHGKAGSVEGNLILFPKSPDIIFNVFAVQQIDADGFTRQYTLINFDDPNAFKAIREKLQKFWDEKPNTVVNGRNKFVNTEVRVKVTGKFNVVDAGQANPQVLLSGPEAITLVPAK